MQGMQGRPDAWVLPVCGVHLYQSGSVLIHHEFMKVNIEGEEGWREEGGKGRYNRIKH